MAQATTRPLDVDSENDAPTATRAPGISPALSDRRGAWMGSVIHAATMLFVLVVCTTAWGVWATRPRFALASAVVTALAMGAKGTFRTRMVPDVTSLLTQVVAAVGFGLVGAVLIGAAVAAEAPDIARLASLVIVEILAITVSLVLSNALLRRLWTKGIYRSRALIIGTSRLAEELALELQVHPTYGVDVVGFLGTHGVDTGLAESSTRPAIRNRLVGSLDELESAIADTGADRLIVAPLGEGSHERLVDSLRWANGRGVPVFVVPRLYEMGMGMDSMSPDRVRGFPLVRLQPSAHPRVAMYFKRALDATVASLVLVLAAPTLAVAALLVKLTSRGPVFFSQVRVGQYGRKIVVRKLRTMAPSTTSDTEWTAADRITPLGRILRRTSLDELPQLLSVVKGDMSLVGPRPERPAFVAEFSGSIPGYDDRHRMPVGLTGLAQIVGLRGDTSILERVKYDNLYIDQWSLARDLQILIKTAWAILRQGAYEEHQQTMATRLELLEPVPVSIES